jgi:hypothetical protein
MTRLRGYDTGPLRRPAAQIRLLSWVGQVGDRADAVVGADAPTHLV